MSKPLLNKLKIQNDEISDIITSFDLRAVECGEILTDTNDSHGEVFSHYFRINYIEDGKAYYRYEGRTIELETGSVAFLEPNVTLSVDEGKPVKILFVNFEIKAIDKRNLFIKEMNDFGAINEVYATYFTKDFPCRSCVEVARLPKDVMLEIEAIALK